MLEDGSLVAVKWLREKIIKGHKHFEAEAAIRRLSRTGVTPAPLVCRSGEEVELPSATATAAHSPPMSDGGGGSEDDLELASLELEHHARPHEGRQRPRSSPTPIGPPEHAALPACSTRGRRGVPPAEGNEEEEEGDDNNGGQWGTGAPP
ncbi:hypothetical protein E2562_018787 [Oryza meyeriana var. granulata]|uniref:Uncharacterized protein n=1 Tax=Oryza meyeriana var. granulata TaxID=110450 RepID=A0A6G1F9B6_9ORYZ|nr:hypothetical protein E2562_018787 [Oryza meyeriana var. granulata]